MNIKRCLSICSATVVLLSLSVLGTRSEGRAQNWVLDTAPAPTTAPSETSMVSTEVTLVGQIIPAPNTGPDTGSYLLPGSTDEHPRYPQPMEYHLYNLAGDDFKLTFSQNISYNDLWQNWAGHWVIVTGTLTQPGVFQVKSFQATETPATATPTIGTPQAPQNFQTQQITVIGQIILKGGNPVIPDHSFVYLYNLTDIVGNSVTVAIWSAPECRTRTTDLHGNQSELRLLNKQWAKFTGWIFRPPRDKELQLHYEILELQSIQAIVSPALTTTPVPLH